MLGSGLDVEHVVEGVAMLLTDAALGLVEVAAGHVGGQVRSPSTSANAARSFSGTSRATALRKIEEMVTF